MKFVFFEINAVNDTLWYRNLCINSMRNTSYNLQSFTILISSVLYLFLMVQATVADLTVISRVKAGYPDLEVRSDWFDFFLFFRLKKICCDLLFSLRLFFFFVSFSVSISVPFLLILHFIELPFCCFTVLLFHCFAVPLFCCSTVLLFHCFAVPLFCCSTVLLFHCFVVPLFCCSTVLLFHCFAVPLFCYHCEV